jgi:fructose-1,6-bisphosphatase/inositol monophosphatase family enzyme
LPDHNFDNFATIGLAAAGIRRMGAAAIDLALIASGTLHARVQATYDVSEIREAVAAAAAGERDGKILVVPSH